MTINRRTLSQEYEEGHNLDWLMARLWTACDENLPDCRRLLLQTVKECLRQILMALAVLHDCGWLMITDLGSALREDAPDDWMHIRATFEGVAPEVLHLILSADLPTQVEPISFKRRTSRKAFVAKHHEQWANAHAAGSAVPVEAERLAELIPDINEHTPAVRLSRRLLHPDPTCRSRY
ncbi:hypothetical protein WJX77_010811 [Trebouxia sp. C0004]